MQSPSERPHLVSDRGEVTRSFADDVKSVARLEFVSVEDVEAGGGIGAEVVSGLKEELSALEHKLQEQAEVAARHVDEARLLARLLARKEWEQELERRILDDRAMVRKACDDFERERTRYFLAVERQVVKLSLAIAARVLHREANMDPLLLAAVVRVALDKVKEESHTKLHVPMSDAAGWSAVLDNGPKSSVQVVGDEEMAQGECVLDTTVGTVELGIVAQLAEIEQGFCDLLEKRPA